MIDTSNSPATLGSLRGRVARDTYSRIRTTLTVTL
jgi:hypothetical protein